MVNHKMAEASKGHMLPLRIQNISYFVFLQSKKQGKSVLSGYVFILLAGFKVKHLPECELSLDF